MRRRSGRSVNGNGRRVKAARALWLSGALCASGIAGAAQVQEPLAAPGAGDAASAESQADFRVVSGFAEFAGSEANARSLVTGLRLGSEIMLTARARTGQTDTSIRFMPSTRPMGYGNVRIALGLAQEQLAQLGITQPTPGQIKAALSGGAVTSRADARGTPVLLPGVLPMHAHGMGWSRIAAVLGLNLGHAMSGRPRSPLPAARGADPAPAGITSHAAASASAPTPARVGAARRSRASTSTPTGAAAGVSRTVVAKPAEPVKRRAGSAQATEAPVSTAARAAGDPVMVPIGKIDTKLRRPGGERPQKSERSGPAPTNRAEHAVAGPVAAVLVEGPQIKPNLVTGKARAEPLGAAAADGGPEPAAPTD